ncbi:MAG: hypothetical protein RR620_12975 [Clostridium sp.]
MYAYYCIHKFHWKPSEFVNLPINEKAFVMACIDERVAEEKKEKSRMKKSRR